MKKLNCASLLLLLLLSVAASAYEIKVMSFNIRYDNPGDAANRWDLRKLTLCKQIQEQNPDFIGLQEVLKHQLQFVDSFLMHYTAIGKGRDDGNDKGEFSPILFRKDRFYLLQQGQFWLSTNPDSIGKAWDAALPRICTWVKLKEYKTGKIYWVFNTHFDHLGVQAREKSAALLVQQIRNLCSRSDELILTGDFNMESNAPGIELLSGELNNAAKVNPNWDKLGTFNAFREDLAPVGPIDYIFYQSVALKPINYQVITTKASTHFASDHYAIVVTFTKKEGQK